MRVQRAARDRGSELMNFQCRVHAESLCGTGPATSDSYHLLCKELIWPHTLCLSNANSRIHVIMGFHKLPNTSLGKICTVLFDMKFRLSRRL
jgi:hypothetical protein